MASNGLVRTTARFAKAGPVHPILVQSWQRSGAAGLDRDAVPVFRRVPDDDLERRRSAACVLLEAAVPHLRWLSAWFAQRPHVAYLVDRDGIVLHAEGDRDAIAQYHLSPGHDWSEAAMGTNGAGTALAAGVPVAVVGCDHWSVAWQDATCLGAPVFDGDGRTIGAIDISMDVREGDAERLVIAAHVAYTISQELARHDAETRYRSTSDLYTSSLAALDAARHDITTFKEAEAALRVSERRLQTIIDSTPAMVYVVDAEGRFQLLNRRLSERYGVDQRQALGRSLFDFFPADVAEQFARNNRRVLESRTVCEFEEDVPHADGDETYLSVKAPLFDAAGEPYAVCGVSTDITERKRLISALELAQRQKDAVLATVAHELRQPLGAIQAALALMRTRSSREKGERARAVVERQVTQLARLVDDLLDTARMAQGKMTLRRESIALNAVIEAAVATVQPLVGERGQHLDLTLPAEVIWLDADAARLQQVFSNLLINAAKFTGASGRIALAVEPGDHAVTVRVRDEGQGIAAETLPSIFDLFNQAAPDGRGLGIGLALVRGLVERHGGTVHAHSEGLGKGSEFIVRLPRAPRR